MLQSIRLSIASCVFLAAIGLGGHALAGDGEGALNVPDLHYNPITGNITLIADGANVISFGLESDHLVEQNFSTVGLPAGFKDDNVPGQLGWLCADISNGEQDTADLGNIMPVGLDLIELDNALIYAEYGLAVPGGGGGEFELFVVQLPRCDFTGDGLCNLADIDKMTAVNNLVQGISSPPGNPLYDVEEDGFLDQDDLTMWLSMAATENGFATPYLRGDADLDHDVDSGDITTAIINFTGSGGTGLVWSDGDNDGDGDVDTGDVTNAIINFTGAMAQNAGVPDLIYDPATGNVTIDADGTDMISFSLQNGPFNAADFSDLPAGLTDNIATQVGWTSFNLFTGLTATADLGNILPAGLDLNELQAALTTATYGLALSGGGGGGRFDIIIPEPGTLILLWIAASVVGRRKYDRIR